MVPDLGLGIRPRRPRMRPELADHAHHVGRRERDVELEPAGLDALDQVLATDLVGAGLERLLGLVALGEHERRGRSCPCRAAGRPCRAPSGRRGAGRRRGGCAPRPTGRSLTLEVSLSRSIAASGLVDLVAIDELGELLVLLAVLAASVGSSVRPGAGLPLSTRGGRAGGAVASGCDAPRWRARAGCWLAGDLDAHRAGGALDDARRGLEVDGVEVGHLDLGDLADLGAGDRADRLAAGGRRALLDARRLAQQVRGGRGLEDEREAAVLEDGDLGGDDLAASGPRSSRCRSW